MIYFVADDGIHGDELWKSDGTDVGTVLVEDIAPGDKDALLSFLIDVSGWLFFTAMDRTYGNELWLLKASDTDSTILGGTPVDGLEDWFLSDWFGYYSTAAVPWIFHSEHGFLYLDSSSSNQSMFIYDDAMHVWWWTSNLTYPFLYAFDPPGDKAGTDIASAWLWYFEETKGPRSFGVVTGDHAGGFLFFNP